MKPKTIFLDIDGTILCHMGDVHKIMTLDSFVLEGVVNKIIEWNKKNYNIILTTGRKESMRRVTEKQLEREGIVYDKLIMGLGGGQRIVINDVKPEETEPSAKAIVVLRNKGLEDINI